MRGLACSRWDHKRLSTSRPARPKHCPICGLAICNCCDTVYFFSPLGIDEETFDLRVFGIYPREREQFDALVAKLSVKEAPKWPMWLPTDQDSYGDEVSRAQNERPNAVILTTRYMDVVLATHLVTAADNEFTDWNFETENSNHWFHVMLSNANRHL